MANDIGAKFAEGDFVIIRSGIYAGKTGTIKNVMRLSYNRWQDSIVYEFQYILTHYPNCTFSESALLVYNATTAILFRQMPK